MDEDILKALCCDDDKVDDAFAPDVARSEQFDYLVKNINFLKFNNKQTVCRILLKYNDMDKVSDCNDGIVIMQNISDAALREMYNLTYFELNRS